MARTWMLSVLVVAGCTSLGGAVPTAHDDGFGSSDWRTYRSTLTARESASDSNGIVSARWYLEEILALAGNAKYGATPSNLSLVTNGVAQRRMSTFSGHTKEQSWVRLRLAYLHALDRDWSECAEKLQSATPGTGASWPDWKPESALPRDVTIGQLLSTNENDDQSILGALKHRGHAPAERARVANEIRSVSNPPFPHHGAETAWTHTYLARLFAETVATDAPCWNRIVSQVMGELDQG